MKFFFFEDDEEAENSRPFSLSLSPLSLQRPPYKTIPSPQDPEYPVPPGTLFEDLPSDWGCPVCGAGKPSFRARAREIAGFAENQRYGLGTNSMTGGQKSGLIYGALAAFFALFIAGYFMD